MLRLRPRLQYLFAFIAVAAAARFFSASAAEISPMERVARALGTPQMGYSVRNDAHTYSLFEWVPRDETVNDWSKMFTVVATHVPADRTHEETTATILRLRTLLEKNHALVSAYDVRDHGAPAAYFYYVIDGEIDAGVIYSPLPGIITTQQVAANRAGVISVADVRRLQALIDYPVAPAPTR